MQSYGLRILPLIIGYVCLSVANADTITRMQLENGLTVLLKPIPTADNVAVMTLFSIGNDHDPSGKSGLAHLVEHLFVCCRAGDTPSRTVHQFIQAYPAGWNAYTGDDFTVYATVVPRDKLSNELKDASARMTRLEVTAEELEREKGRLVAEVSNMFGGKPELAVCNRARQQVRPGVKGSRRGGVPKQVEKITVEEVQKRVDRLYKPGNAILVIAGGFEMYATRAKVEALFSSIPAGERIPGSADLENPNPGRTTTEKIKPSFPGSLPQVCFAYPAPLPSDPRYVSFLTIASRLMLQSQRCNGPNTPRVQYAPLDDPSVLLLYTATKENETVEQASNRLTDLLDEACNTPLRPLDLQLVRNGLGAFLGLGEVPDAMWAQNPYGLAFSIGRRYQMGVETAQLRHSMVNMTSNTLRKEAEQLFASKVRTTLIVER